MRILFLLTQDLESPSGLGRYLPMARHLARSGHGVKIAALHSDYRNLHAQTQQLDGVQLKYVAQMHVLKRGSLKLYFSSVRLLLVSLYATIALAREALLSDADLIIIGKPHPMNSIAALIAKWLRSKPIALDCDDYETATLNFGSKWQEWIVRNIEDRIPRHVQLISTNTHFMESRLQSLGVPAERIYYMPNGVDPDRFSHVNSDAVKSLRETLDLTGKAVVAYIGTINIVAHPIDLLLEAFLQVRDHSKNVVLLVVGGGEDYQHIQSMITSLGIQEDVRMVGRVKPELIKEYYQLADVIVDPVHDNDAARGRSPLKLFESWISEVPYITGDVGDRRLLLGDPMAGILFQPANPDSLASEILALLADRTKGKLLARQGLDRLRQFEWDSLMPELARQYQTLGTPQHEAII